jgi:hypothetical protein
VVIWNLKNLIIFYRFSDLRPKKIAIFINKIKLFSLFVFHPPLHHLHCKYGAPKQAKHEKINGPFQNKVLFQNKFLFLFCPPLKYFSLPVPILLSEQIVQK